MRPDYDSRDDSYDSRFDSSDSRDDRPPPRRSGLGLAGVIVGMVAAPLLAAGVVVALLIEKLWTDQGSYKGPSICALFYLALALVVLVLIAGSLAASLTGVGLGIGGIVRGRGIGRRLGIYAVGVAVVSLVGLVGFLVWIYTTVV
jgi:hypothetical protein